MATTDHNGILRVQDTDLVSPLYPTFNALAQSVTDSLDSNTRIYPVANETARAAKVTQVGTGNISSSKPLFVWRANATVGRNLEFTTNGSTWSFYSAQNDTAANRIWNVANITGRTNLFNLIGASASRPLYVHRQDAPVGRQLEYNRTTSNVTDNWHYVKTSEDDTGWVQCPTISPFQPQGSSSFRVRRTGNWVSIEWGIAPTGVTANSVQDVATVPVGFRPPSGVYLGAWTNVAAARNAGFVVEAPGNIQLRTAPTVGGYFLIPSGSGWYLD